MLKGNRACFIKLCCQTNEASFKLTLIELASALGIRYFLDFKLAVDYNPDFDS